MTSDKDRPRTDPAWVAARFDRIARTYPLFERLLCVPASARRRAIERSQVGPGDRVLVVGCGHGPSLKQLSTTVGQHGQVVGVDLSEGMLQRAHRTVAKHALANVQLLQVDLFTYRPEEGFQAILFEFSLSSFGEPLAGLRHAWSMLEPGGRLVLLDGQLPPSLRWFTRPLMPLIRWVLERTVLGDPDMRPIEALRELGVEPEIHWFRHRMYFAAEITKPIR